MYNYEYERFKATQYAISDEAIAMRKVNIRGEKETAVFMHALKMARGEEPVVHERSKRLDEALKSWINEVDYSTKEKFVDTVNKVALLLDCIWLINERFDKRIINEMEGMRSYMHPNHDNRYYHLIPRSITGYRSNVESMLKVEKNRYQDINIILNLDDCEKVKDDYTRIIKKDTIKSKLLPRPIILVDYPKLNRHMYLMNNTYHSSIDKENVLLSRNKSEIITEASVDYALKLYEEYKQFLEELRLTPAVKIKSQQSKKVKMLYTLNRLDSVHNRLVNFVVRLADNASEIIYGDKKAYFMQFEPISYNVLLYGGIDPVIKNLHKRSFNYRLSQEHPVKKVILPPWRRTFTTVEG